MENWSISAVGYFISSGYIFNKRALCGRNLCSTYSRFTDDIRNTSPAQPV